MKVSNSRIKLAEAFKELLRSCTLEEATTEQIVSKAKLSRQTFYKNFSDKYELAFWCYEYDITPIFESYVKGEITFHDMNLGMLRIFRKDKEFYGNLFMNFELQNSFFQQFHNYSISTWTIIFGRQQSKELFMVYKLYTYGCNNMILDWVISGMKESDEEMAELFDIALPECMKNII